MRGYLSLTNFASRFTKKKFRTRFHVASLNRKTLRAIFDRTTLAAAMLAFAAYLRAYLTGTDQFSLCDSP